MKIYPSVKHKLGAMEFSQIFGFFKILAQSIKISFKNLKLIAPITLLSLLLSSILVLLFTFTYHCATIYVTNSATSGLIFFFQIVIFAVLVFSVELTFLYSYIAIDDVTGIATVIATAAPYTATILSPSDLISAVRSKWRIPSKNSFSRRACQNPIHILWFVTMLVAPIVMRHPNPVTITVVSVVGVSLYVIQLYVAVVPGLAFLVIPVVVEGCDAAEAVEMAEKLVHGGQQIHGFMVNLFITVLDLSSCLGFWLIVGDKGKLNLTVYGLFFVNCALLTRIFVSVVYTVYYFQCKEYHGNPIQPLINHATVP